jgi:signal transduction histidine kinase/CheY-like chemotaxis protein
MNKQRGNQSEATCGSVVILCATCMGILGVLDEVGWALNIPVLKSVVPGFISMNPMSALMFILGSITLLSAQFRWAAQKWVTKISSFTMVLIGGSKDLGYLFGQNIPSDRLLFWSKLDPSGPFHGNALAPNAALCFVLFGLAIPVFARGKGRTTWATVATVIALALAVSAFVGYAFAALPFYRLGDYAPMALTTSISSVFLGVGCVALRPDDGIAKVFTEESLGSILLRRVLPVATLTPFFIGVARWFIESHHLMGASDSNALAIATTMLVIAFLIVSSAKTLNATDKNRKIAELQLTRLADQLREEAAKSNQANLSKSMFLANMSHEVRTPLNGVLGTSAMLEMRDLDPEVRKLVGVIRSSGETLLRVIDDILDLSKIEAGKLELEKVPVNLAAVVRDMVSLYQGQATPRDLSIIATVPSQDPPLVLADSVRLKQVLGNLLSNAVKFTSMGGVDVILECTAMHSETMDVRLSVKDTGIGIPLDRQEAIFDTYAQADDSTHRRFGGTGLGLSISKRLIEMMDGTIELKSEPACGSVFSLSLRFQVATASVEAAIRPSRVNLLSGRRILLAEDNEVNAMVATALLEDLGCQVTVVGNGLSAIAAVAENVYDCVLMDIQMPVCNGLEATKAIRQLPNGYHLRIVALTASAMNEDRAACSEAGMDSFLSKPFSREGLVSVLTESRAKMPQAEA